MGACQTSVGLGPTFLAERQSLVRGLPRFDDGAKIKIAWQSPLGDCHLATR